jgi:hypothetical protein
VRIAIADSLISANRNKTILSRYRKAGLIRQTTLYLLAGLVIAKSLIGYSKTFKQQKGIYDVDKLQLFAETKWK